MKHKKLDDYFHDVGKTNASAADVELVDLKRNAVL